MDFKDTPEEARWREEVRDFIEANVGDERLAHPYDEVGFGGWDPESPWRRSVARRGWLAPAWPTEYGGAGMSIKEQFILNEEFARARAPQPGGIGVALVGPTIIVHGTEEQKREFLPKILSGETIWCQGFSEPGAGSDLAGVQTRAVRDGDGYRVTGQKIWTTMAHCANWCLLLVRTDPDAPKHRGLTLLLVDMRLPGITVRPIWNLAGEHEFNEVFFDNVFVPRENLVGVEGRGWYAAATTLDYERSSIRDAVAHKQAVQELVVLAQDRPVAMGIKWALTDRAIEAEVCRVLAYRIVTIQAAGRIPNYEAAMNKLFASELKQRIANTAVHLFGLLGQLSTSAGRWNSVAGVYACYYLRAVSATIAAGTSEINRNVIATRGLGLPRS